MTGTHASALRNQRGASSPAEQQRELVEDAQDARSQAEKASAGATRNNLRTAARKFTETAALFQRAGLRQQSAKAYIRAGEVNFILSRFRFAVRNFNQAIRVSGDWDIDSRCSAESHLALTYVNLGDSGAAFEAATRAIESSERSTNPDALAEAKESLGETNLYSGAANHSTTALNLFLEAEAIFRKSGNNQGLALTLLNKGLALNQLGAVDEASAAEKEALEISIVLKNEDNAGRAHAALGLEWVNKGEPDKAKAEYDLAFEIFHRLGDLDNEAVLLNSLAGLSSALGNHQDAFRQYRNAEIAFSSLGDLVGKLAALAESAREQRALRNYNKAEILSRATLQFARAHRYPNYEAAALIDIGDVYKSRKQYSSAKSYYLKALNFSHQLGHVFAENDALIRLAQVATLQRDHPVALGYLRQALGMKITQQEAVRAAYIHFVFGSIFSDQHQYGKALDESEAAVHFIESERLKVSDFDSRASYFASVHNYYQLYIDILMQLDQQHPDQDFAQRGFEAAEKSKVRSLLDMLASSATEKQCPAATAAQAEIAGPQASDCGVPAPSALTLEQVQTEIHGDNAVLLEYALAPDASYLWVVDERHISTFRLPGEKQISELARRYRRAIAAHQPITGEDAVHYAERFAQADQDLDHLSRELSRMLLGPMAHLLTGKQLIVVPDGLLRYVPFAALQLPSNTEEKATQTLAEKFEIVTLPSASALNVLREASANRPAPTKLAKVFADPVFEDDDSRVFTRTHGKTPVRQAATLNAALRDVSVGSSRIPRLEATGPEADAIQKALSGNAEVAKGFDANREAVLSGNLGQYRYIHFATHGLLDSKHPEFSGLILSLVNQNGEPEEGYVRVRDIYGLKLSADLVVLSSCNSALGKDVESEGIIGLTRAFLFAGSKRVISSLWKVDDEATKELMKAFYSELHRQNSPAAALRSAQSTLARDPHWKSPYYWAAFILQGEYK